VAHRGEENGKIEGMNGLKEWMLVARSGGDDTAKNGRNFGGDRGSTHGLTHMHEETEGG
jgi:hypothetical protein